MTVHRTKLIKSGSNIKTACLALMGGGHQGPFMHGYSHINQRDSPQKTFPAVYLYEQDRTMLTKGKHLGKLILRSNYKLQKLSKWSKYNIRILAPPPPSKLCWLFKPGLGVFKSGVFLNGLSAIYTNLSIHAKFPSWHTPVKTSQKQYKYYNKLVQPQIAQLAGRIFMYNQ